MPITQHKKKNKSRENWSRERPDATQHFTHHKQRRDRAIDLFNVPVHESRVEATLNEDEICLAVFQQLILPASHFRARCPPRTPCITLQSEVSTTARSPSPLGFGISCTTPVIAQIGGATPLRPWHSIGSSRRKPPCTRT